NSQSKSTNPEREANNEFISSNLSYLVSPDASITITDALINFIGEVREILAVEGLGEELARDEGSLL
ncbi:5611_t:CDS:2, partial [Funneliformis geosporum]